MSFKPQWDYHILGIESGILQVLTNALGGPDGYVRTLSAYNGELDEKRLREVINDLLPTFPLMLVTYTDGDDDTNPAVPVVAGEPFVISHKCTFSVLCCSDDARGEGARKAGVYKMMADARRLLSGLKFSKTEGEDSVLLNELPLTPSGVEYLARLPELTAYAQHFDTNFRWETPDRRVVVAGESITTSAEPMGESRPRQNLPPGVVIVD
jgi:phage gp37-like protein